MGQLYWTSEGDGASLFEREDRIGVDASRNGMSLLFLGENRVLICPSW